MARPSAVSTRPTASWVLARGDTGIRRHQQDRGWQSPTIWNLGPAPGALSLPDQPVRDEPPGRHVHLRHPAAPGTDVVVRGDVNAAAKLRHPRRCVGLPAFVQPAPKDAQGGAVFDCSFHRTRSVPIPARVPQATPIWSKCPGLRGFRKRIDVVHLERGGR